MKAKIKKDSLFGRRLKERKNLKVFGIALLALIGVCVFFGLSGYSLNEILATGSGVSMAGLGMIMFPKQFSPDPVDNPSPEEKAILEKIGKKVSDEIAPTKKEIEDIKAIIAKYPVVLQDEKFLKEHSDLVSFMIASKENPSQSSLDLVSAVRKSINDNKEKFASLRKKNRGSITLEIEYKTQATQVPGDIGTRTDYAEFRPGTVFKPVRRIFMRDIFRTVPTKSEYIKYREEDTITRDAKVVVACATSTHTTKKTWTNRTIQIQKIKDKVDICIDMIDDYDFVEAEIKKLVETNVQLKSDNEIFNGSGTIMSIDSIASEFDPANVLAVFTASFQAPTLADLTAAMSGQIYEFGQQNTWIADTIIMNNIDWIIYMHKKDSQNNYLLPSFVLSGGTLLNGMRVVVNPLVSQNNLYVFDSTKGEIIDRKMLEVVLSYENNDNVENDIVTVVASERLQFHVTNIDQDAFMKCSDVTAALALLTGV